MATERAQITLGQEEGNIIPLAIFWERFKALRRLAEHRLVLMVAVAALSCWHLVPVFAQMPAESWAVSADDADATSIDGTTPGQISSGAADQAPKADTAGQSSPGSATSAPSTAGTTNQSSTESEPKPLRVNPVTGLVSASAANYEPLTGSERVNLYFKMNYASVGAYFGPFFTALVLDQTTNSPAQWGGGFKGYGRRVASRIGDAILQGTFQAPAAAVLHEDVRYIVSTNRGFRSRAWHAIKYSFLTYNDKGRPTLNVANLGAYYASTAVSTAWLPGRRNVASYTLSNATEQIGLSLPVNLLQEFWPQVRNFVLRQH